MNDIIDNIGLFGRQKEVMEESNLEYTRKALDDLTKEWKDISSKPLSDRELLKEILKQLYFIRGSLETLHYLQYER